MPSSTVENYVKQLYLLEQAQGQGRVSVGRLAESMVVVPGTATAMVKALADSGLVQYAPRVGVRLSRGGRQLALHVLRRHRLVELFLVRVLGLDWADVHDEAEELEHAISEKVLQRIDEILGHPSTDPHGDPIPSAAGKLPAGGTSTLLDCPLRHRVRIARVLDQDPAFLRFVDRSGLMPGTVVRVDHREPSAAAVALRPDGGSPVTLGMVAAAKIVVDDL